MHGINVYKNNELPIRLSHYSLKIESLITTEKYFPCIYSMAGTVESQSIGV